MMVLTKRQSTIFAGILMCSAGVLSAADGGHGVEHGGGTVSLFAGDLGNAIWTLLIFAILLAVLGKFAWKPILTVLQKREDFIRDSLKSAKHEREEAKRLLEEYTLQLNKAREEATAIVEEGKRDAEAVRKRIHHDTKTEADAMIARARKDIEMARDEAVKSLYDQAVVLATTVATKIVRKELTSADHRVLLDESLAELENV